MCVSESTRSGRGVLWTGWLVGLIVTVGCSGSHDGPERRAVRGQVTYAGQPIEHGMVRFLPQPDGPVVSLVVSNGQFEADAQRGVPVGLAKVEIVALPNTAAMSEDDLLAKGPPPFVEIPQKYNTNSELTATITPGAGIQELNFTLEK